MNNILIVVADCLRADSPQLESLIPDTTLRYTEAWACGSATIPAYASMYTGLLPHSHGAVDKELAPAHRELWLDAKLKGHGYNVYNVCENPYARWQGGYIDKTTHVWDLIGVGVDIILNMVDTLKEPWAIIYHSMITHFPYNNEGRDLLEKYRGKDPDVKDELRYYYDESVETVIDELRELEQTLAPCVSILTSDHGDGFLEHGYYGHPAGRPWPYMLRVPLFIRNWNILENYALVDTVREPMSMIEFPLVVQSVMGQGPIHWPLSRFQYSESFRGDDPRTVTCREGDEVVHRYPEGYIYYNVAGNPLGQEFEQRCPQRFKGLLHKLKPIETLQIDDLSEEDQRIIEERLADLGYLE